MAGMTTRFEATGVAPFLAKLHSLGDVKQLEKTTRATYSRVGNRVIKPRLAKTTGWKYGGHKGAYPTKGILGDKRKITARRVRTRVGEFVAVSVKHRGWSGTVAAWTIKGTKPHVIRARAAGQTGVDSRARRINRGTETLRDRGALAFGGRFASIVEHPGAAPTDFVHDAVQGLEKVVMDELARDLFKQADKAARGKK